MKRTLLIYSAALLSNLLCLPMCFAQGSLTPPGAPAQTMKSLEQIESRIPISSAPYSITNPGSYYLTTNLTVTTSNVITILANQVTLDLNGFTLRTTSPVLSGFGIQLPNFPSDIRIFNGHIRGGVTNNGSGTYFGGGFNYGIGFSTGEPENLMVSHVTVYGCQRGLYLVPNNISTIVENCTARSIRLVGISGATVRSSNASDCGDDAITALTISDSTGHSAGNGRGIAASATAMNCYGNADGTGHGVTALAMQNCEGRSESGRGVSGTTLQNCYGTSTTGVGVFALTAIGCVGSAPRAIQATVAIGCYNSSGTNLIANKYNMP